jgi:hypothetical protein
MPGEDDGISGRVTVLGIQLLFEGLEWQRQVSCSGITDS